MRAVTKLVRWLLPLLAGCGGRDSQSGIGPTDASFDELDGGLSQNDFPNDSADVPPIADSQTAANDQAKIEGDANEILADHARAACTSHTFSIEPADIRLGVFRISIEPVMDFYRITVVTGSAYDRPNSSSKSWLDIMAAATVDEQMIAFAGPEATLMARRQ